jgi:hypothetical protein
MAKGGRKWRACCHGRPVIDAYFRALSETMTRESQLLAAVYRHPGKLGENRESLLSHFLATYLPARYGVGTGFALLGSELSTQQDVVVFDALDNPVLFPHSTAPLFPPSALAALVEVKSCLTKRELIASAHKATRLKRALRASFKNHPEPPVREALACVFAFTSTATPSRLLEIVREVEEKDCIDMRDRLDLVCVLGTGVVLGGSLMYATTHGAALTATAERPPRQRLAVEVGDSLFVFYARLLDYLTARPTTPPQLMSYLPPDTPMGIVSAEG